MVSTGGVTVSREIEHCFPVLAARASLGGGGGVGTPPESCMHGDPRASAATHGLAIVALLRQGVPVRVRGAVAIFLPAAPETNHGDDDNKEELSEAPGGAKAALWCRQVGCHGRRVGIPYPI
jgi:hypothetical protein